MERKSGNRIVAAFVALMMVLLLLPLGVIAEEEAIIEEAPIMIGEYFLYDDSALEGRTSVGGQETANHKFGVKYDAVTKTAIFDGVDLSNESVIVVAQDVRLRFDGGNSVHDFYIDPSAQKCTTTFYGNGVLNTTGFRASFWEFPNMKLVFEDGLFVNIENPNDTLNYDENGNLENIDRSFSLEDISNQMPRECYVVKGNISPALEFDKIRLKEDENALGTDVYAYVAKSSQYKIEPTFFGGFYPYLDANGGYFIDEYGNQISGKYYETYGDGSEDSMTGEPYFPLFEQVIDGWNATPMRSGYVFEGWCYDALGETECGANDSIMPDEVVYAKWSEAKHTIHLHGNNGTLRPDAFNGETFPHNVNRHISSDSYILEEPIKMGDDNTFEGWYYDIEYKKYAGTVGDKITVTKDIELYAKYSVYTGWPNPDISYYDSPDELEVDIAGATRSGDYYYELFDWNEDGNTQLAIVKYIGNEKNVVVPDSIDGKPVEIISREAFAKNDAVETIVFGEGVKEIDSRAFYYCDSLKKVVLPSTLRTLAIDCFTGLKNMTDIYCLSKLAFCLNEGGYSSFVFPFAFFPSTAKIHVYSDARFYDGSREDMDPSFYGGYAEWKDYKDQVVYDLDDIDLTKLGEDTVPDEPTTKPDEPVTKPDEPTTEPTTKPSEETTKPAEKPTTKPSEEPTTKPSEESTTKPSEENTTKPAEEPNAKINGVVKSSDGKWALYENGKVKTSYTGIAKNQYGWWRVKDGYVDFNANGIYKNEYGWWKTTNGKVTFNETGIFKNEYGWWRVENSKVNFQANGIYKNDYGWWKTTNGKVTFKENGVFKNEYGWWKVENSKVNFNFTGIASNKYGKWYVKNGKVDFTKNGKVKYNGKTYTVVNGKVK